MTSSSGSSTSSDAEKEAAAARTIQAAVREKKARDEIKKEKEKEKEKAEESKEKGDKQVEQHKRTQIDKKLKGIEKRENRDRLISDLKIAQSIGWKNDKNLSESNISLNDLKNKNKIKSYKFKPLKYDLNDAFTNEKIPNKFNNLKAINFEVKGLEQNDDSIEPNLEQNLLNYLKKLNQPSSAKSGGKKNKTKKQKITKNTKTRKKSK